MLRRTKLAYSCIDIAPIRSAHTHILLPSQERTFKRKTIKSDKTMQYTTEIDMFFNRVLCTAYSQLNTCFRPPQRGWRRLCVKRKEMPSTQNGNFSLVEYARDNKRSARSRRPSTFRRFRLHFVRLGLSPHTWEYRMRSYPLTHNASVNNLIHQGSHRRCR